MKVTSETWFTTSGWYEAKNGPNGSCNFVFNSGPQVCSGPSIPKHAVKYSDFSGVTIGKCIFPLVKTRFHLGEYAFTYFQPWFLSRLYKFPNHRITIPPFSYRSPPLTVPSPSFLRFWNRSKTLTRLEEEFETLDVFRVIYSNNWNLFSSQFIVKYLLSSFPFWITVKMQYDWRKVVELLN